MLNIEQKYKDLFNTYGGKSIRLVFYKDQYRAIYPSEMLFPSEQIYPAEMSADSIEFEISNEMIHSETLTITESLCSDENLDFGACEAARMEIVVSDLDRDIAGKEFILIESFADYELVRGLFTVDSTPKENDRNTRRIIAYDRMRRFDNDVAGWYNTIQFPITLRDFRASLCDFIGVSQVININLVNDDMIVEKTLEPDTLYGRDVIKNICQINGVFGNINQIGELRYVSVPAKNSITDTITRYKTVESEEYMVPDIDTVWIRKQEGDIGGASDGGDGMNTVIVEGNFLVYGKTTSQQSEIANNVLSVVSGLEYRPAEIVGNGAPWYEMGDRIAVETSDGTINTIIMSRTSTGIQGVMDEIVSTGSKELKQTFSIRTQVLEAKGLVAVLKRTVEEVSNELTNFESQTNSKFSQTAEQITAEVTRATREEGKLSARIQVNADAITQRVTSVQAESLIEQKADSIRLKANAISWSSANSSMTADGTLNCVNGNFSGVINALNGGSIGGFRIDGDSLVAKSNNTRIQWGKFSIDYGDASLGEMYVENFIEVGGVPDVSPDDGDITALGDMWLGGDFWYGRDGRHWSVTESVKDIYDYIHGGGWNPSCPSHDSGDCSSCDEQYVCGTGDCSEETLADDIGGCGGGGTGCKCDGHTSCSCDGHTSCTCDDYGSSCGCDSQACGPGDG